MFTSKKKLAIIVGTVLILSLIFFTGIIIKSQKTSQNVSTAVPEPTSTTNKNSTPLASQRQIARVGSEIIYAGDLENELAGYPKQDEAARKLLLEKLVNDSKILQIGIAKGVLQPANDVFNSPEKDYAKRIADVSQVKGMLEQQLTGIKGTIISIWFLNDHVGPLGYDRAKQVALEKITPLHEAVAAGKMTIADAATAIRNDPEVAKLDPTYKTNAQLDFNVKPGEKITWETGFDDILWQTKTGGVTEIFTGKSFDFDHNKEVVPAYFMFAQVSEKSTTATYKSLNDLISAEGNKYEVNYF